MEILHLNKKLSGSIALLFIFFAFTIASCKKFVVVPPPTTKLVTTSVFNNNASATSALINIYINMFNNDESYYMSERMGLYADELKSWDASGGADVPLYTNALAATNIDYIGPWFDAYQYIYQANAVIEGLKTISGCSPTVKQQLTGEALFIRAYWDFYLTNIYGDVPLVLTTNYNTNATIPRTSRVQVLQRVVADLEQAQSLLNTVYVNGSDSLSTTERVRPNKAAATALLARAYLYLGDYSHNNAADYVKADSAASAIISNNVYSLAPLANVFLANSSEAIWQIQTPQPAPVADTYDGEAFILISAPQVGSSNSNTISQQLMNEFDPGDQRPANWISSITEGTTTYYFPYKYKQNTYVGSEYTMVLRMGEQYLIRAEARAHENNLTGAASDLNMIRKRAGLPNTTAATQSDLLTAILRERQVELFSEWGHRWFDLCRTGNAPSVLGSPGNVCTFKGGTWNPDNHQLLFPIPQGDINKNHNLTQNQGY